jgi:membrane protein YdbS with pleckstrin-like domain
MVVKSNTRVIPAKTQSTTNKRCELTWKQSSIIWYVRCCAKIKELLYWFGQINWRIVIALAALIVLLALPVLMTIW